MGWLPVAAGADSPEDAPAPTGFAVRAVDADFGAKLEDVERYGRAGEWEKAFRALGQALDAKPAGMVQGAKGFWLPWTRRVWDLLAGLPPEGRKAYRLFHDAKAKRLLDAAGGDGEQEALQELFQRYFITSSGDSAADRLGDALYEQGAFEAAARCWQAALDHHPDSEIPPLRLHVKRAHALARAGRAAEFADALGGVRERWGEATVRLGGREVVAWKHLESLAPAPAVVDAPAVAAFPAPALPASDAPLWQFTFLDAGDAEALGRERNGWGWTGRLAFCVPASSAADGRVYVNWYGCVFALDAVTGKLLWRGAAFRKVREALGQRAYMINPASFALAVAGDRLFAVGCAPDRIGQGGAFALEALDAATGKTLWKAAEGAYAGWSFLGAPAADGDTLYAAAVKSGGADLALLAIGASDGALRWKVALGTRATQEQNFYGRMFAPPAGLAVDPARGLVHVLTNDGALLAVHAGMRRLEWAFTYETAVAGNDNRIVRWAGGDEEGPPADPYGVPAVLDGTLCFKGAYADALYALDPAGPALLWRRPAGADEAFAAADADHVYLLGEEVVAVDRRTRALRWSTRVPVRAPGTRPLVAGGRLYVFGTRGLYELDRATGDVLRIFRGADLESAGGVLRLTSAALVTVSNRAVTAYAVR